MCRGALSRVADRLLQAKQDLHQMRAEQGGLLRATYAAVRGNSAVPQEAAARGGDSVTARTAGAASDELAVLGTDGPFRVSAGLTVWSPAAVLANALETHHHAKTGACLPASVKWRICSVYPEAACPATCAGHRDGGSGGALQALHGRPVPHACGGRRHHPGGAAAACRPGGSPRLLPCLPQPLRVQKGLLAAATEEDNDQCTLSGWTAL